MRRGRTYPTGEDLKMSSDQSGPGGKLVERIEKVTELPMLILAVAYIPAFIISYLPDVSSEVR